MGKLSDDPMPSPGPGSYPGDSPSAISLDAASSSHPLVTERYFDDDPAQLADDDLPPLYSDVDPEHEGRDVVPIDPLVPSSMAHLRSQPFRGDAKSDTAFFIDRRLETDAKFLEDHITMLSHIPPRPFVHLRGTHRERRRRDGKTERAEVVDFDIKLELTHLLYTDIRAQKAWRTLSAAGTFEKVRRGTVFATRAPGFGGSGAAEAGVPDVKEWCHRFCASHAGLRSFTLERRISGWDWDIIRRRLEGVVRATNYRGKVDISFPVQGTRAEIYNDCLTNRWRLTKWIEMMFVFTLLFLFTWPYLFFRTKRWETVHVDWQLGRVVATPNGEERQYAVMSEERWYNMWARPIEKAILERRQGVMDQADLTRVDEPRERPGGFVGVVRAGVEAMGAVNRSFGWGGDSC